MNELYFISLSFAWLVLSAMVIQGFYLATRDGEIFGWWERFFDEHHLRAIQLKETALVDKYIQLLALDSSFEQNLVADTMGMSLKKVGPISNVEARKIELLLSVTVVNNKDYLFLFEQYREYRFPWWARKMASCSICMSGWIGTLAFIVGAALINPHSILLVSVSYFMFLPALVFINRLIIRVLDGE